MTARGAVPDPTMRRWIAEASKRQRAGGERLAGGERRWRMETALLTEQEKDWERTRNRAAHATGLQPR